MSRWKRFVERVHHDEQGAVSLETILIVGMIALPILLYLLKVGWPKIKSYFNQGLTDLESEADTASTSSS